MNTFLIQYIFMNKSRTVINTCCDWWLYPCTLCAHGKKQWHHFPEGAGRSSRVSLCMWELSTRTTYSDGTFCQWQINTDLDTRLRQCTAHQISRATYTQIWKYGKFIMAGISHFGDDSEGLQDFLWPQNMVKSKNISF